MKLLKMPALWLGALSAILLALDAFSLVPISFGWATAPLWIPLLAVCGIAGSIVGIVACIVLAVVGICFGVMGLVCAIVAFVCALILALLLLIAALAVAAAICAGALATMYFMFGGNIGNAASELKKGMTDKLDEPVATEPEDEQFRYTETPETPEETATDVD